MNQEEQLQLNSDIARLRSWIKDAENNGSVFEGYIVACRLVLEKADELEQHAHQIPGMGHLFTAIVNEFRQLVVGAVLWNQTALPGHPKDVTS